MAQSVELTLDPMADVAITEQWRRLAEAGLPSAQRSVPSEHHRPHITLFAGDAVTPAADEALPDLVGDLDLAVRVGAVLFFGPRRDAYVFVRQVVPSTELLDLQHRVAELCGANRSGQFGPGRWTPHVTLARRIRAEQIAPALDLVASDDELDTRITQCRRWDGDARTAWWLTSTARHAF